MKYCLKAFPNNSINEVFTKDINNIEKIDKTFKKCEVNNTIVCAIRENGPGYTVREFSNKCELEKYNIENNVEFIRTEDFICKSALKSQTKIKQLNKQSQTEIQIINEEPQTKMQTINDDNINNQIETIKNLVVVRGMFGGSDVNESIDNFFAGTHVFDLPVKEVDMNTRRRLIKNAGPVKIFVPLIVIPEEKKNDTLHRPTLSTCYHTCPTVGMVDLRKIGKLRPR